MTPLLAQIAQVAGQPLVWIALLCIIVLLLFTIRHPGQLLKDPDRAFNPALRREGFARAGSRCEYGTLFGRCPAPAEHADHFFPHSRGGATTLANHVAACSRHNLAKSDRMPTRACARAIARRRTRYFPSGVSPIPGQWYGRPAGVR